MSNEQDWIFTFGSGGENAQRFVKIHGTYEAARDIMVSHFGRAWAFQYPTEKAAGVGEWRLQELFLEKEQQP